MTLSTGQQATLFTIALILVAVGAISSASLASYGFPPIAGFVTILLGIIGAAIIKGYGLAVQSSLANPPTGPTPNPPTTNQ